MTDETPKKHGKPQRVTRIRARGPENFRVLDADKLIVETARSVVGYKHYVREVVERRALIRVLASRNLKSSYELNIVGFLWWLVEPLSLTFVYYVLISALQSSGGCNAGLTANGMPCGPLRLLFVISAVLPFKWLTSSVMGSMSVVRANATLVTDVYFPRALLPITEIVVGLAHFLVGLLVIPLFILIIPGAHFYPSLIWMPVIMAVQFVLILGLAYPMCVWGLYYRNLPGVMGNLLRLWFYLSPSIYPITKIAPRWRWLMRLNPLTGIFESYRGAILYNQAPGLTLVWTLIVGCILIVIGGFYFTRREPQFGKLL
jgi:ABC-type polysaccharide/polyol phosphate export permease